MNYDNFNVLEEKWMNTDINGELNLELTQMRSELEWRSELMDRLSLCYERIGEISKESTLDSPFKEYFNELASFICLLKDVKETKSCIDELYNPILPNNYETCYGNPDYIYSVLKESGIKDYEDIAKYLCYLYSDVHAMIPYAYEKNVEVLTIFFELFIEIYVMFENAAETNGCPKAQELKDVIYWFNSDYCDVLIPQRIDDQLNPGNDFAVKIVMDSDLSNTNYLYKYGEYVTDNEIGVAEFLASLSDEEIEAMASTYTEGYRIGFVKAGKPLEKKNTVNIRYCLGFERIVKAAIGQFNKMGLKPVIYRASLLATNKARVDRIGYYGAIPNKQFDYDHKDDRAIFLDKDFVNRKTLVTKESYEARKELAAKHAGPAVIEIFGEEPFTPVSKNTKITLDVVGQKCAVELADRLSQITNEYIKGDERSFTIIAYPIPEIGPDFVAIFRDTVKLNTLDYMRYESMQQTIIDALDTAEEVRIEGKGINKTNLIVKLQSISDATKQSKFENCVADVNIPVGEVFTSPKLKGTNGILNVSSVYLNGLKYDDLCVTFKDGMITDYTCSNFADAEQNKNYIKSNVLFNRDTLPMGEFAIGTNTTAYRMARDYNIEDKLPILIGEKTGPHFAVGDTCYSHEEDVKVYNPDGKEIIARDNEITKEFRNIDSSKAYFNCHTDITIPYDEIKGIYAICNDGTEIAIIEDGRFVLEGLSELNIPLNK